LRGNSNYTSFNWGISFLFALENKGFYRKKGSRFDAVQNEMRGFL